MDAIITIIVIAIFIIRAVKNAQEKAEKEAKKFEPRNVPPQQKQPEQETSQPFERTTRSMDYSKSEIGKKIPKQPLERPMYASGEGVASQEGECIEPNANHCSVEHYEDSIYEGEITDEAPVKFNRENLVQGVIMAEILKPKWSE